MIARAYHAFDELFFPEQFEALIADYFQDEPAR
jgi:hypothetical protein